MIEVVFPPPANTYFKRVAQRAKINFRAAKTETGFLVAGALGAAVVSRIPPSVASGILDAAAKISPWLAMAACVASMAMFTTPVILALDCGAGLAAATVDTLTGTHLYWGGWRGVATGGNITYRQEQHPPSG